MDTTPQMPQYATLPSRHFWRRAVAYLIDIIIFQAAILIAVYCISTVLPLDFRFPGWSYTQCGVELPDQLAKRIDAGWPLRSGEVRINQICEVSQIGSEKQRYLQTGVSRQTDNGTSGQWLTIPVDADDNPVIGPVFVYSSVISGIVNIAFLAFAFAYFSANGRRTIGKKLLGLRVQSVDGKSPGLGTEFRREILKFSPYLFFIAAAFAFSLFPVFPTEDFDVLLRMSRDGYTLLNKGAATFNIILGIAALIWWFLPFIFWRGQTFYDRICACKVVKS
ncbi:MAG: RDD family protein [Rhizobium sp.]|uniref:RDD family protein n=1 Tax=Rhizobium TaxID=379 RepID=UPI001C976497|nr:RDD family protein [Rhizobium leguminosarum]MBY5400887.1 RDD family protein [Rhizobium leguminosarum]UWM73579.1 RDD family protein [Rhizobium leguminosarum bv. viciae]